MINCIVNGRFLTQSVTGVQRYGREIISAIDHLLDGDKQLRQRLSFEILVPPRTPTNCSWRRIPVRAVGRSTGHRWEQIDLPRAIGDATLISLANTGPLRVRRQLVTIHDASVFAAPEGYSYPFRLWYRFLLRGLTARALHVVTDSRFSQRELERFCNLESDRASIIPLGVDHLRTVVPDSSIIAAQNLSGRPFVLTAGSLNPNKNIAALHITAQRLSGHGIDLVVVGGGYQRVFARTGSTVPPTVRHLGYVTDAELRALYEHAVCFVFPSRYEGFGLPPLEAMACGCPVVVSRAASLPEVCGDAALYIDPDDAEAISESVMALVGNVSMQEDVRRRGNVRASGLTWANAAKSWLDLIKRLH